MGKKGKIDDVPIPCYVQSNGEEDVIQIFAVHSPAKKNLFNHGTPRRLIIFRSLAVRQSRWKEFGRV